MADAGGRGAITPGRTRWSSGLAAWIRPTRRPSRRGPVLEQSGESIGAAIRYRELHADLLEKNKPAEALARFAKRFV